MQNDFFTEKMISNRYLAKIRAMNNCNNIKKIITFKDQFSSHANVSKSIIDFFHTLYNTKVAKLDPYLEFHTRNTITLHLNVGFIAPISS